MRRHSKKHASHNQRALSIVRRASQLPRAEVLEGRQLLSSSWFVSPSGSDKNPGSLNAPFQTIQAAANVAQPGDVVQIEAGTYHETVNPKYSGTAANPIVYTAYNGANVTITGADQLGNWTSIGGNVYQTSMPWDLGEGNNQLFVDGKALNEARWPNTSLDLSHPTLAHTDSVSLNGTSATINDASLTQTAGYWVGAVIHINPGEQWEAQTGTVTSSSPGKLTFTYSPGNSYELPSGNDPYYLTGSFKALDAAGEWYRDPSTGKVYIWTPGSDDPGNHDVEAKARHDAFDLTGNSYISIRGVNIFSSTIRTDKNSSNVIIDSVNAKYVSQYVTLVRGWAVPNDAGIMLDGPNDLLENSTIAYSSGDGVYVKGAGSRVTNSIIHDVDYNAGDSAGIRDYAANSILDHNTIYNSGRDGILHEATGVQILYNTIHDAGLQTTDCGAIYTVRTNGGGTVIAYNQVYNVRTGGYGGTGIYLDNNSSNYVVHNNQTWNVDTALKLNFSSENEKIYNNTLDAVGHSIFGNYDGDWNGTTLTGNVFLAAATKFGAGANVKNNVAALTNGYGAGTFTSGANLPTDTSGSGSSGSGSSGTGSTGTGSSGSGSSGTGSTGSSGGGSTGTGSTGSSGSGSTGSGGTDTGSTGTGSSGTGSTTTGSDTGSSGSGNTDSGGTSTGTSDGSNPSGSGSTGDAPQQQPPVQTPSTTPPVVGSGSGSSSTGSTTTTGPTLKQLHQTNKADHQTVRAVRKLRHATLKYLRSTRRADKRAFRAVSHQLAAAKARKHKVGSNFDNVDLVTTLSAEALTLRQTIRDDSAAIATNRHTDHAAIHAARKKLAHDLRVFRKAMHKSARKLAA